MKKPYKYFINCNDTDPDTIHMLYRLQLALKQRNPHTESFVVCYQDPDKPEYVNCVPKQSVTNEFKIYDRIQNFFVVGSKFTEDNCTISPLISINESENLNSRPVRCIFIKDGHCSNEVFEKLLIDIVAKRNKIENDFYKLDRIKI